MPAVLEGAEVVADLGVGPVGVANDLAADDSLSINDVGLGPSFGVVELGGGLLGVAYADEIDVMTGEKPAVSGWILVNADCEDCELRMIVLKLKESRYLLNTRRAPCGPEIQQYNAATITGEVDGGGAIGNGEVRSDFAGLAGVSAAIASRKEKERRQGDQGE